MIIYKISCLIAVFSFSLKVFAAEPPVQKSRDARKEQSAYKEEELKLAARTGSCSLIKSLLDTSGRNIKASTRYEALKEADRQNRHKAAYMLLERGVLAWILHIMDSEYKNAFELKIARIWLIAARCGHLKTIQEFLKRGMPIDETDEMHDIPNSTALYYAVKYGHKELVIYLLEQGASPYLDYYAYDTLAQTVLHAMGDIQKNYTGSSKKELFLANQEEIFEILLDAAPDLALMPIQTREGLMPPLYLAVELGLTRAIRILLARKVQVTIDSARMVLKKLAKFPYKDVSRKQDAERALYEEIFELLLDSEPELVSQLDVEGQTLLHYAVKYGLVKSMRILLERGANPNENNIFSITPWHVSLGSQPLNTKMLKHTQEISVLKEWAKEVMQLLMDAGADLSLPNDEDIRIASWAMEMLEEAKKRSLITNKIVKVQENKRVTTINKKSSEDREQFSPQDLYQAVRERRASYLKDLMRKQISFTEFYREPAQRNQLYRLIKPLAPNISSSRKGNFAKTRRAQTSQIIANLLAQNPTLLNSTRRDGTSLLHVAAMDGRADIAEILIRHGAQVNARTKEDWTPLQYAADYDSSAVAELLLQHGAEVNTRTVYGSTPLVNAREEDRLMYLFYGTDPDLSGWTSTYTQLHKPTFTAHEIELLKSAPVLPLVS